MPSFGFGRREPARPAPRYTLGPSYMQRSKSRGGSGSGVPWRALAYAAGSSAAIAALLMGTAALYRSDLLRVKHVQVVGAQVVEPQQVALAASLASHSLLHLDSQGAEQRIRELPGVIDARVHRDWPQGVVIDLTERQGWGYWQVLGTRSVIDAKGRVVDKARAPTSNAPTVYEVGVGQPLEPGMSVDRDTVALVTRLQSDGTYGQLGAQPQRYEFERSRGLLVRMAGAPTAIFGDSHDYEFKVAAWVATSQRIKAERMKVNEIDLRFGKELVVR